VTCQQRTIKKILIGNCKNGETTTVSTSKKKVLRSKVTDKITKKKVRKLKYTPIDVENALKAMKNTGLSLWKAAVTFGVPLATLGRKKSIGPDEIKKKSGPETVLSSQEEDHIVKWALDRAAMGAPVTKTELLDCVQKYVQKLAKKTPFTDNRPSRHWYEGFRKRHPELSIRKPQHLSVSRAAVSCEELQEWFKNTGAYLESKNLSNISPTRIFNCDESSLLLCPDAESVLAEKGSRAVYKIVDGGKEALTVLFMYRADGVRDNMKNEKNVVVSGFKGSGLYPFDPKVVDYDILQKGKKSKEAINQKENNLDSDISEDKQFLLKFEKNLQPDTLSEFQNAAASGLWIGAVEKKGLFEYWLEISKNTTNVSSKQLNSIDK
ncbi:Protein of unknown function, partial [Cotesia congregata]